jgi:eukaryotic translation initiation factor 2C
VVLWANYVEMIPPSDLLLYRYHVEVKPDLVGKKLEQMVRLLLEMPELAKFQKDLVTDFRSTIITRKDLGRDAFAFEMPYRAEKVDEPGANAKTYRIDLTRTGSLNVGHLTEFLTSTDLRVQCGDKLQTIQALNILLRHYAKSSPTVAALGSTKTFALLPAATGANPNTDLDLTAGLVALRGFFSSVRVATCRILVNINVSHGAFYSAIRLDKLIRDYQSVNGQNVGKLEQFLQRLRVKLTHLPEKKNKAGEQIPRIKTIFALAKQGQGQGLEPKPTITHHGAGPKDVKFFLENSPAPADGPGGNVGGTKKGQKGSTAGAQTPTKGKFISVFDYFLESKYAPLHVQM